MTMHSTCECVDQADWHEVAFHTVVEALADIAGQPQMIRRKGRRSCRRFSLRRQQFAVLIPRMATKTTFVCDCCFREADSNLGWAHIQINGTDGGRQLMPDDARDLCEICWSPLQVLMKKVHEEARDKRNLPGEK
jgi:hypothetical protein